MARPPQPSLRQSDPTRVAMEAVQAGDLRTAQEYFAKAVNADKKNAAHRYNFALCSEQLGQIDAAIREYSNALHLNRTHSDAARRLAAVLRAFELNDWSHLDEVGLAAAFRSPQIDTQPLANAALLWLKSQTQLGALLKEGEASGHESVARGMLSGRPNPVLGHELLQSSLALGINKQPDVERLLTALRRVLLLEAGPDTLADKTVHTLALCLAEHGLASGYIWMSQPDEEAAAAKPVDFTAVKAGDVDAAHRLLLAALYAPLSELCRGKLTASDARGIKPKAFRDLVIQHLSQTEMEQRLAAAVPRLGTVQDATSKRVASHYGDYPYPRWTNVQPTAPGAARRALGRFFAPERLQFMDGAFDVLVAGCGTGHQPVDMALSFGPSARILGVDLSRASLAYGQRIANANGIKNVELAEADILDLPSTGRTFDMVICSGVLHHMADPMAGWRALNKCLKPGGIELIALYSAVARADLKKLRDEPSYPGTDCTLAAARAWRQTLFDRKPEEAGGRLTFSQDFYSLPEFRDAVLHPSEQHLTIPQIEAFLKESGLIFRGFLSNMETLQAFGTAYPDDKWPGTLANWDDLERKNPTLFEGMYQFWCEKPV